MKKYALTFALLMSIAALAYAAVQLPVSGIGVGYGSDRAAADQDADQSAQNNMQGSCAGVIVQSRKTGDQCTTNIGNEDNPKFMCTVSYTGTCQIGR